VVVASTAWVVANAAYSGIAAVGHVAAVDDVHRRVDEAELRLELRVVDVLGLVGVRRREPAHAGETERVVERGELVRLALAVAALRRHARTRPHVDDAAVAEAQRGLVYLPMTNMSSADRPGSP
jgi:hypothetical protein